jgi:lipopolysaccharide/colanic/teichoic acid biosynthesis glycosyltransferase
METDFLPAVANRPKWEDVPDLKFRSMIQVPGRVEVQAGKDDPRITRVGRVMRMTAMDELPQIWNIFTGDMSFVGPRSQPEKELVRVAGEQREIHVRQVPGFAPRQLVRPGLTGVAQIFAPREVPHRNKFKYDLIYVRQVMEPGICEAVEYLFTLD